MPDCLSYETGALIEPLAVASHAVQRAGIRLGESVLVIGDGMIGIMIAAMCKKCGASSVILSHELTLPGTQGYCFDFPIALEAARELFYLF